MNPNIDKVKLSFLGIGDSPDETEERKRIYEQAKNQWPVDPKISSCAYIQSTVKNVQNAIDAALRAKTQDDSKGNQRVQNRYIDAYTWYRNDVQTMYNNMQCEKLQDQEESQQFFETQYDQLEKVKGLSEKTGNTTKYIIFGMLVLVVGVAGYILLKKD